LDEMRVGVIDVGSNTTRLLVASAPSRDTGGGLVPVDKEKVRLSLGEEIERFGSVSDVHVMAAAKAVRKMAEIARHERVESLDVFLTAPGRQAANSDELVAALSRAAGVRARVLSKEEEGTLAYRGAVLTADIALPERIAVCDIGGASTEIAVGSPGSDPDWIESVDLGSVRLTTRGGDLRAEAKAAFATISPPEAGAALVVGGSARAARRLVGAELGQAELAEAIAIAERSSVRQLGRAYDIDRARAHIVPAGLALLAEVQALLGVPLHVCSGGIREGAVLASLETLAA
jgi:exopolyphosphatase / guanosine-5'-triphosphate,3'-diphosphate pyrophosphatase